MSGSTMTNNVDNQQYCLRWNNHRTNLLNVFDQLLQTEAFTDVTLAVNGTSIKCHKMVLAACSSYFQSLFLENSCAHPIVVFKDIQYSEIRAILEYMYRGEVNVAQEDLPSLLKVAEALRVKGLFEDDPNPSDATGVTNSSKNPTTSNAHTTLRSTSGITVNRNIARARSATPTPRPRQAESPTTPSSPAVPRSPQVQVSNSENPGLMFPRHPSYLYKSPLLSPQGEQGGVPLGMWPPLVMPLHLGAIENALREREQALAMANIQRMKDEKEGNEIRPGNGAPESDFSRDNESGRGSSSGFKRKRLTSDVDGPLLRNFLGAHMKTPDLPGLFPFRMATEGSLDERAALNFLPNVIAHAERQSVRERERDEDSWNQTQEHTTSEEDASENVSDYSGLQVSPLPQSDKRGEVSGGRLAGYVPTQKLEWKRYKQYTTNDISAAIEAVRGGMSALQASRKFKVPSRTLYDKVKKLGIATTRPYSRVSSSTSGSALHHQNPNVLSSYAAQSAAFTSAVAAAASALSLAKQQQQQRERGPVIQVVGSNADDSPEENTYGGTEESNQQATPTTPTPLNGRSNSTEDSVDPREGNSSSPLMKNAFSLPQRAFLAVRDELNSAAEPGAERKVASPIPSVPGIKN